MSLISFSCPVRNFTGLVHSHRINVRLRLFPGGSTARYSKKTWYCTKDMFVHFLPVLHTYKCTSIQWCCPYSCIFFLLKWIFFFPLQWHINVWASMVIYDALNATKHSCSRDVREVVGLHLDEQYPHGSRITKCIWTRRSFTAADTNIMSESANCHVLALGRRQM